MSTLKRSCPKCGLEVQATVSTCPRDGSAIDNPFETDPNFQQKYEFLESIGAGGMGVIYKARHLVLNKLVAIKMVHSHLATEQALQRFQIEGKAAASLSHPYIIVVHDFGTTISGQPYMVLDFLTGKTLSQVLAHDGHLDHKRFLRIFLQITDALAHAHKRGVLHRDIKPANIMIVEGLDGEEEVRIMDFGLAKMVDDEDAAKHLTKTGIAMGSPYYMSPEQARGAKVDHRADIYSLGCTMFEALAGTPPFDGKTPFETMLMHLNDSPPTLQEASLGQVFDPRLQYVMDRILEKSVNCRYQSVQEVQDDLRKIQRNEALIAEAPKPPKAGPRFLMAAAAGIGLSMLLALAILRPSKLPAPAQIAQTSNAVSSTNRDSAISSATTDNASRSDKTETPLYKAFDNTADASAEEEIQTKIDHQDVTIDLSTAKFPQKIHNKDLKPLETSLKLADLSLKGQPVDDNCLPYLRPVTTLTRLNLESTHVETLRGLDSMKGLRELIVAKTRLNRAGVETIGRMTDLRTLDLSTNKIKDADLVALYRLNSLKNLNLIQCPNLTETAVDQLKQHLKNCNNLFFTPVVASDSVFYDEGMVAWNKGDFRKASVDLSKAALELQDSKNQKLRADCLWRAAGCKFALGDFAMAANQYESAVSVLAKVEPNSAILADVYSKFALNQEAQKKIDDAIELRSKAAKIYALIKPVASRQMVLKTNETENLYHLSGDQAGAKPQVAAATLEKARQIAARANLNQALLEPLCTELIADGYMAQRNYTAAAAFYKQAIEYYQKHPSNNAPYKIDQLQRHLAATHLALKLGHQTE